MDNIGEITLPEGYEMVGVFKLKDKEGKSAVKLTITGDVREVIVQKFIGEKNKIIIAVKKGEYETTKIITPDSKIKLPT